VKKIRKIEKKEGEVGKFSFSSIYISILLYENITFSFSLLVLLRVPRGMAGQIFEENEFSTQLSAAVAVGAGANVYATRRSRSP